MSGHTTRPTLVEDATVEERHLNVATEHAEHTDTTRTRQFLTVASIGGLAIVATAAASTLLGPAITGAVTAAVLVATITGGRHVVNAERRDNETRFAQALAYLEALRGKDITNHLLRFAETNNTSVLDVAADASMIAAEVGTARTHQLMVRAQQSNDYSLFQRLNNATRRVEHAGVVTDDDLQAELATVIDQALASKKPIGSVAELELALMHERVEHSHHHQAA